MLVYSTKNCKYGVANTFYFALEDITDAEAPFTGVAPVAADIWLVKDGGVAANATNAAAAISNGVYSWVATATEMQAVKLSVSIYDATASAIFKPVFLDIETTLALSFVDIDASQKTNQTALKCTGSGTGNGIYAVGGATDAAGIRALGTGAGPGFYSVGGVTNAAGIVGTGQGSGAGIHGIGGATNAAGLLAQGTGTGPGLHALGGATGIGFHALGGGGNAGGILGQGIGTGQGLYALGGAAGIGLQCAGNGVGAGFYTSGGLTNAAGIVALGQGSGPGVNAVGGATNAAGLVAQGTGTGAGLHGIGGATNAVGIMGQATGSAAGFHGISPSSNPCNFFSELLEDVTTWPNPGTTTLRQAIAALIARFYYLVTQTSTQQKQYKSDSATLVGTSAVSDDGVTQTKGRST